MKISIVTIAYNSAGTIEETIRSVAGQTYPDIEYIVVDGASTDETGEIVGRHPDVVSVFQSEPDEGIYDAMNKGVRLATGDVIGLLNADDLYPNRHVLEKVANVFQDSAVQGVYGDCVYADAADLNRVRRYWRAGEYREGRFLTGWMPPHPTFFVRRECYEKFGLYRPEFKNSGDYELMLRFIHKHGIHLRYIPEVLVTMREGGVSNNSLKNRLRANREDRAAWRINELKPGFLTTVRKPLGKVGQFMRKPENLVHR